MLKFKDGVFLNRLDEAVMDDDGGIIVDTNTGRYLGLNRVALEMVSSITETESKESVLQGLQEKFEVDRTSLERDLDEIIEQLLQLDLVEV